MAYGRSRLSLEPLVLLSDIFARRRLITRKMLPATQPVPYAPWAIRPEDLALAHVQRAAEAVKQGHRLPQPASETQLPLDNSQT